jgi:hypothetical protein
MGAGIRAFDHDIAGIEFYVPAEKWIIAVPTSKAKTLELAPKGLEIQREGGVMHSNPIYSASTSTKQ